MPDFKIIIKSEEERFVLGPVYYPDATLVDTDNEFMDSTTIEHTAHSFLMSGRVNKVDAAHARQETGCKICESYIVRWDNDIYGFPKGTWVVGAKILNDALWEQAKKGDLNGFSWSGPAVVVPVSKSVKHPLKMIGTTEPYPVLPNSDDSHVHELDIPFSDNGKVIAGLTSITNGHQHPVYKTTATGEADGHSHRINLEL